MNIYVGNLPYQLSEQELRDAFAPYGEVTTTSIITDRYTGQSKGFAFVEMTVDADAENAIKALDGSTLKGRTIKVNQARPRTDTRPPRRDRDRSRDRNHDRDRDRH